MTRHLPHALAMRMLVAIACTGCVGLRVGAGPTVTTNGDIGVQVTATTVWNFGVGIGGGGSARADTGVVAAAVLGTFDYTLPNVNAPDAVPTRLTRFAIKAGQARLYRDSANETAGVFGAGVSYLKVRKATQTCTLFGSTERTAFGGEATLDLERRSTGAVGVIGAGVTYQFDTSLNIRKCD